MVCGRDHGRRRVSVAAIAAAAIVLTTIVAVPQAEAQCPDLTVTAAQGGGGLATAIDDANACVGPQTIQIESGFYSLDRVIVTDAVTITAADPAVPPMITGAGEGRHQFLVYTVPGLVTLSHLVVQGGFRAGLLSVVRSTVEFDSISFVGSTSTCGITTADAVRVDGGDLTVRSSAIASSGCSGIASLNGATVTVDDLVITSMARHGITVGGSLTVMNSRIHDNASAGIRTTGADGTTISGSAIYSNGTDGILSLAAPLTISNSVVGAEPDGAGGLLPAGNGDTGIDALSAETVLQTVVVAHNRLGVNMSSVPSTSSITSSEIRDNLDAGLALSRSTVTMETSDLADNSPDCSFFSSTLVDAGDNSDTDGTCSLVQPNSPPTADVDRFDTDEDTALAVDAPGVLDGDGDPDGDQITAELLSAPANAASFQLFADGSFDYVPAQDFFGLDTFEYRAVDSASASSPATVDLIVRPINDSPAISGPGPLTADLDTIVPLPITVADVDADDPPGEEDDVVPAVTITVDGGELVFDAAAHPQVAATVGGAGGSPLFLDGEIGPLGSALATGLSWRSPTVAGTTTVDATIRDRGENGVGGNLLAEDSFEIAVVDRNRQPLAADDSYTTDEDVQLVVAAPGVLTNDTDPDGDPLTATLEVPPALGSLALAADGGFSYTPDPDANGSDVFTYSAGDGSLQSDPATVTIEIEPVSEPWTLDLPVEVVTDEDVPVVFTALLTDPDGLVSGITASTSLGTVEVAGPAPDGTVTFTVTPDADVSGSDTISIGVTDPGGTTLEFVPLIVTAANDAPAIAAPGSVMTEEDVPATFEVTVADVETAADALSFAASAPAAAGELSWTGPDAAGLVAVTFTPAADANGDPIADVTIEVGDGETTTVVTVPVTVTAVDDAPVASPDSFTADEDTPLVVDAPGVLGNDTDADGDPLTATLTEPPTLGTVALAPDGSFVYTPDPDVARTDSFTYTAADAALASPPTTVTIDITAVNDAPTIDGPAEVTTDEDVPITFTVQVDDAETAPGDLLVTADVPSSVGSVALAPVAVDGAVHVTFAPVPNLNGVALGPITLSVDDGIDAAALTVAVTITAVDDAPVAAPDAYTTPEDTPLLVPAPGVLANDEDLDGQLIAARLLDPPAIGAVTLEPDGSFAYTPAADAAGNDSFTYVAENADGASEPTTVTVMVEAVDDPPSIDGPTTVAFEEDTDGRVEVTVSDPDTPLSDLVVEADMPAAVGTLSLSGPDDAGTAIVTITPTPDLSGDPVGDLVVTVSDATSSTELVVTLTIIPVDDPPVGTPDAYITEEDTPLVVDAPGVLANDTDPDGEVLSATLATDVSNGTLMLAADGGFSYTPDPDHAGMDAFTYAVSDDTTTSGPITVTIHVAAVNDPPVAADDAYTTEEDTPLVVDAPGVLANDTDIDGDTLTATLTDPPTLGTLELAPDGSFTYTPDPDLAGTDSFTYTTTDGTEGADPATVTIDITPLNDAPVAVLTVTPDTVQTGVTVTADGSASTDVDGEAATFRFDWGDGTVDESADATADHTYDQPGAYTVTLIVGDTDGTESAPVTATVVVGDATLHVNTEVDAADVDPADGICWTGGFLPSGEPACSFRAAVQEANGRGVASVIAVPPGDYPATGPSLLLVDVPIALQGAGTAATRIGPGWNLFQRAGGEHRDITFLDMQVSYAEGDFDVRDVDVRGESTTTQGGLAVGPLAAVTASGVTVDSRASSAVAVTGLLTGTDITIAARVNSLDIGGGRVELEAAAIAASNGPTIAIREGGSLLAKELTITQPGLGIIVEDGSVELIESSIGGFGRALWLLGSTSVAVLQRSTVDGLVDVDAGTLTVDSSTVDGTLIASGDSVADIGWSTISGRLHVLRGRVLGTVVAGTASDFDDPCTLWPEVIAKDNADASGSCGGLATTNLRLGPLADNGGPTATRLPEPGSDLVDAADEACPAVDQRGVARPIDGRADGIARCDIGAVEAPEGSGTVPLAVLSVDPVSTRPGDPVTFDASASFDPDGAIILHQFDFDDGTTITSADPVVTHAYPATGFYRPTVTVVDDDLQVSLPDEALVAVRTAPLEAVLDVTPSVVAVGATVTADASASSSPEVPIVSYRIDWGDGTVQTILEPTASHDYDAPGEYDVTLEVADAAGTTAAATATVRVFDDLLLVNTTDDDDDLDPADGICFTGDVLDIGEPACSLRAAVAEANARGVPSGIVLGARSYPVTQSSIVAEVDVAIVGDSYPTTVVARVGAGVIEPLVLQAGGSLTSLTYFGDLEVAAGTTVELDDFGPGELSGRVFVHGGGALQAQRWRRVSDNTDLGIYVLGGTATIVDGDIGRVEVSGGTATVRDQSVGFFVSRGGESHVLRTSMGAALVNGGDVTIDRSQIIDDLVVDGNVGEDAAAEISASTLGEVRGGDPEDVLALTNVTVAGDVTGFDSDVTIDSSTIKGHVRSSGPIRVERSAIANTTGSCVFADGASPVLLDNVDSDGSCGGTAVGDLLLAPLADNGGPTPTYLPLPGSPLVDAAGPTCPSTDQRGVVRPIDGDDDLVVACDAGAVEAPSGSGGPAEPAQIEVLVDFAGAPIDEADFDVDVVVVGPADAMITEATPLSVDPGWAEVGDGCSGSLMDSTGARPTCSGSFAVTADRIVELSVEAVNNGVSPYATYAGDCASGAMTVGRGATLECRITFVRPDAGDTDPAVSAILRLDKRWVAPFGEELPDGSIGVSAAFSGVSEVVPLTMLRDGALGSGTCAIPADCEFYVAFRPAPLDLGVIIPDLLFVEEELPEGWQAFYGGDCDDEGEIDDPRAGELLTCTITNVDADTPSPVLIEWHIDPVGSVLPVVDVVADLRLVPDDGGPDLTASTQQALPPSDQPDVSCAVVEPGVGHYPLVCRTLLDAPPGGYGVEITTLQDDVWQRQLGRGCADGRVVAEVGVLRRCRVELTKHLPERYEGFSVDALEQVVDEGDDERSAGEVEVVVTFDRPLTAPVELDWQIVPAGAVDAPPGWPHGDFDAADVTQAEGVIVAPVGATEATLIVEVVADRVVEEDEGFAVRIQEPTLGGVVTVFGVIRNDDAAPTLDAVVATPQFGEYPLTVTAQAVGAAPADRIVQYRWRLHAPSGAIDIIESDAPTIELDLAEVGTFELRALAVDDAGNASHTIFDAPRTTIEVTDRVPVLQVADLILLEGSSTVSLAVDDLVDVGLAPGGDWQIAFSGVPLDEPVAGATRARQGDCGGIFWDFELRTVTARLDPQGRFWISSPDGPIPAPLLDFVRTCVDQEAEGPEYWNLGAYGRPFGSEEEYQLLARFDLIIVDDDDGDLAPTINVPDPVVVVTVPIGTEPPVKVGWTTTATDPEDGTLTVTCDPASGSGFAFGTTAVSCAAIDSAYHVVEAAFEVIVAESDAASVSGLAGTPRTRVAAGTDLRVRGSGFADDSDVRIELRSDPVVLAELVSDDGTVDAVVTIPAGTPPGEHSIVIVGTDPDGGERQTVLPVVVEPLECTIVGTSGRDVLMGTRDDDVICGFGGDDVIVGRQGDDVIVAGGGDDLVLGGSGDDEIVGGQGDDTLHGNGGDDEISGGDGDDRLLGGRGDDALAGGSGNDRLDGGPGDDLLLD